MVSLLANFMAGLEPPKIRSQEIDISYTICILYVNYTHGKFCDYFVANYERQSAPKKKSKKKKPKSKSAQKKRDIHKDQDDRDLIEDPSKVTSKLCPNLSKIITRVMSGVASGVVIKAPGKKDNIYLWSDSMERDKVMVVLTKPPKVVFGICSCRRVRRRKCTLAEGKNQVSQRQRRQWHQ